MVYNFKKSTDPRKSDWMVEVTRNDGSIPPLLYDLFRRATPYGTEKHIINLLPFKDKGSVDKLGNFYITVGDKPTVMFSCHMDTVHTIPKEVLDSGNCGMIRLVKVDDPEDPQGKGFIYGAAKLMDTKDPSKFCWEGRVLGGDDKIGVYTMIKMVEKEIPGLYVFHVGEECGSPGSRFIATQNQDLVKGITHCVAFDRMGYTDVIAKQRGDRTASIKCTEEIARRLNEKIKPGNNKAYTYKGDVTGMFTDSANYKDIIHECTNVSIGYDGAHGASESFDAFWYFTWFLPAVLSMDWQTLPVDRDCKAKPPVYNYGNGTGSHSVMVNGQWVRREGTTPSYKIAFKDITKDTPNYALPAWSLKDGIIEEASVEGMKKLIHEWIYSNHNTRGDAIFALLMEKAELESENLAQQFELDELQDQLTTATSVVPNLTPDKFQENLKFKLTNMHAMLDKIDIKAFSPMEKNLFLRESRLFRKISKRLRQKKAICTMEDYIQINRCMVMIMGVLPEDPDASLAVIIKNCLRHVVANIDEEGFEDVYENKEDLLQIVKKMEAEPAQEVA